MQGEEPSAAKPVKKAKKALEAPPEPKEVPERPSPTEIRAARKAQLVAWCEEFGLDADGKVYDLRERLLAFVEGEAPEEGAAKEEEAEEEAEEAKEAAEEEEEAEEEVHVARIKPKLDPHIRTLLRLRAKKSAERPTFRRQEWFRYKRLGDVWRKPQGGQSKLRRHFGYRWNLPSVGYRGPREVRGLHPSGFQEVLVHNPKQIKGIDPARQAVRIAHGVGARKRELIEKACEEREIRVLNRMVTE